MGWEITHWITDIQRVTSIFWLLTTYLRPPILWLWWLKYFETDIVEIQYRKWSSTENRESNIEGHR